MKKSELISVKEAVSEILNPRSKYLRGVNNYRDWTEQDLINDILHNVYLIKKEIANGTVRDTVLARDFEDGSILKSWMQ